MAISQYTDTKCCTPEPNIMIPVNYISIFLKQRAGGDFPGGPVVKTPCFCCSGGAEGVGVRGAG